MNRYEQCCSSLRSTLPKCGGRRLPFAETFGFVLELDDFELDDFELDDFDDDDLLRLLLDFEVLLEPLFDFEELDFF